MTPSREKTPPRVRSGQLWLYREALLVLTHGVSQEQPYPGITHWNVTVYTVNKKKTLASYSVPYRTVMYWPDEAFVLLEDVP